MYEHTDQMAARRHRRERWTGRLVWGGALLVLGLLAACTAAPAQPSRPTAARVTPGPSPTRHPTPTPNRDLERVSAGEVAAARAAVEAAVSYRSVLRGSPQSTPVAAETTVVRPDRRRLVLTLDGVDIESLQIGMDTYVAHQDTWLREPAERGVPEHEAEDPLRQTLAFMERHIALGHPVYKRALRTVDGTACRDWSPEESPDYRLAVCVGTQDGLGYEVAMNQGMTVTYLAWNAPLRVELPDGAVVTNRGPEHSPPVRDWHAP